jgi:two-component system, cell cycle response regulator DivK
MPRILIVEDNEVNRDMLSRRLVRQGFEIAVASNGETAIECARMESPDLILMELNLPVMDGCEATRRLKADPGTQSIPVIALSARAMPGERERALEAGCDDFDAKPLDLSRLMGKVHRALGPPDSGRGAAAHKPPRGED